MIGVFLIDDHRIFREGLARVLADTGDIRVMGEAASGGEAISRLRQSVVQVVILDINLPNRNGLDVLKHLKAENPSLPVLMLSMYPEEQYAVAALKAGAAGYLSKGAGAGELVRAIRRAAAGERYSSPALTDILLLQMEGEAEQPPHFALSPREHEIFDLLTAGHSLTDIAASLHLSVSTVSTNRRRILGKLGLRTNADLVHYAIAQGLRD